MVQGKALRPGCHGLKLNKARYQYIWNVRTVPGWVWYQSGLELGRSMTSASHTLVSFLTRFGKCFSRDLRQVASFSKIYIIIFWWVFSFGVLNVVPEFLPDIHRGTEIGVYKRLLLSCQEFKSSLLRVWHPSRSSQLTLVCASLGLRVIPNRCDDTVMVIYESCAMLKAAILDEKQIHPSVWKPQRKPDCCVSVSCRKTCAMLRPMLLFKTPPLANEEH